jgi:hypothetical protein
MSSPLGCPFQSKKTFFFEKKLDIEKNTLNLHGEVHASSFIM